MKTWYLFRIVVLVLFLAFSFAIACGDDDDDDDAASEDDDDTEDDDDSGCDIFSEDWESYTVGEQPGAPWTTRDDWDSGSITIVEDPVSGSKVLELFSEADTVLITAKYSREEVIKGSIMAEFDVTLLTEFDYQFGIAFGSLQEDGWCRHIGGVGFGLGKIISWDGICAEYQLGDWYHIEVLMDTEELKSTVWVNGDPGECIDDLLTDFETWDPNLAQGFNCIEVGMHSPGHSLFDNFCVSSAE